MHYQSDSFAKSGTYTLLLKSEPKVISRNLLISNTDIKEIQLLYSCGTNEFDTILNAVDSNLTKANKMPQILIFIFQYILFKSI